jgi:hypothetical protein
MMRVTKKKPTRTKAETLAFLAEAEEILNDHVKLRKELEARKRDGESEKQPEP